MKSDSAKDAPDGAISRRAAVAGLASSALPLGAAAAAVHSTPPQPQDEGFMREAIALAAQGDFPFGTVIVDAGKIVGRGFNMGKRTQDPTAHGEMVAIRKSLADSGPESLKRTTLYTSGEPCVMCMGAIVWCGIKRVVYAASIAEIEAHLGQIRISCTEIAQKTSFETIDISGGVLADEALKLFK